MSNYQQNGYNSNQPPQSHYPPTTGMQPLMGGMQPPKNNRSNVIIISLASAVVVLLVILGFVLAFQAGKKTAVVTPPVLPHVNDVQQTTEVVPQGEELAVPVKEDKSGKYSRTNPAPIGTEQVFDYKYEYDDTENFKATIKVVEVVRGADAFARLKEKSAYAEEPKSGYEYLLAKIYMSIDSVNSDKAIDANAWDFTCFTSNNEETPDTYGMIPDPKLEGKLYEGGSTEGWALFLVKPDDVAPKLAYKLNYDGTGGAWFALTTSAERPVE